MVRSNRHWPTTKGARSCFLLDDINGKEEKEKDEDEQEADGDGRCMGKRLTYQKASEEQW